MSAQVNGAAGKSDGLPESPAALEQAIQDRRDHLAATIDELTARAKPKEIARRGAAEAQRRFRTMTHGPDGQLRTERLAAVAGAIAIVGGALVLLRRRR
ncbi:MAG TPA: DUF3618 domain-containing protein [Kineosporiaceae bacterium]|jgi:hypothetical protein|nr:DUF3618 domain-containing protein [Kineosporiaceae bacterium]